MKKSIFMIAACVCGLMLSLTSCRDDLDIQQSYNFTVTTLPVQKRIKVGETAEIRCQLTRAGDWQGARYFMRYFQPDGDGILRTEDGLIFKPNDLYELKEQIFRLYYTSLSEDQQVIDIYFLDNFGKMVTLSLSYVPVELRTPEMCMDAWRKVQNFSILPFIPHSDILQRVITASLHDCDDTISMLENFLICVRPDNMNQTLADHIFRIEPEVFSQIPDKFKTVEMCEAAIKFDGGFIEYVPRNLCTDDLYMKAIDRDYQAMQFIPENWKTEQFYTRMVREKPENLYGVPKAQRTDEMNRIAFDRTFGENRFNLSVVTALTNTSLLLQVMKFHNDPNDVLLLMQNLDKDLMTPEIIFEAVKKSEDSIYCVPWESINHEYAFRTLGAYPYEIERVSISERTPGLYLFSVKFNREGFPHHIPNDVINGDNIFSFHLKVERKLGSALTFEGLKSLYAGKAVMVRDVQTEQGIIKECEVRYDRKSDKLKLHGYSKTEAERHIHPSKIKHSKGPKI